MVLELKGSKQISKKQLCGRNSKSLEAQEDQQQEFQMVEGIEEVKDIEEPNWFKEVSKSQGFSIVLEA